MTTIEYTFQSQERLLKAQKQYNELADILAKRRAEFDEANAGLIEKIAHAKDELGTMRQNFNDEIIAVFESTGQKKYCEGRVTIRETKKVTYHDQEAAANDVQTRFPGWMVPDWKRVEKAIKNGDTIEGAELAIVPSVAVNVEKWIAES